MKSKRIGSTPRRIRLHEVGSLPIAYLGGFAGWMLVREKKGQPTAAEPQSSKSEENRDEVEDDGNHEADLSEGCGFGCR